VTTVPFFSKQSAASVFHRLTAHIETPMSAMIEIADRCNEVCVHCYQVQGQKGEMTTAEVMRVIDELAELRVMFLTISGGEPTLRSDFLEIVAHARKHKFAVKLFTNGLSMTPALAHTLAELAVAEVQISLYSVRADVHDWVTRVPGSWERTVAAVKYLVAERVPVMLKTPVMSFNADECDQYRELATSLGADYAFDPGMLDPREDGDRTPEALNPSEEQIMRVQSDPSLSPTMTADTPTRSLDETVCGACTGSVHIEANGEIRPCTQLTVDCGNALTDGVRGALASNEAGRVIRGLTWRDLHGCRDCALQPYCARCYARARTVTGDAMGPYGDACDSARRSWARRYGRELEIVGGAAASGTLGPFRELEPGRFEIAEDVVTDHDRELAGRQAWMRRAEGASEEPARAAPGELVQIRRPGRKRPEPERIPSGAE